MLSTNLAVSVFQARTPVRFDRHIKRLIWCALIGSLALLIAATNAVSSDKSSIIGGLGALMVVIAGLAVVKDVSSYVRFETARRAEAARRSTRRGACQAAEAIQDRVANLLSVTVGYVDFLSEDEHLPADARAHAQRALESALAATRAVSAFRSSLGCGPSSLRHWEDLIDPLSRGDHGGGSSSWRYDRASRMICTEDGRSVAVVASAPDEASEVRDGRLIAGAPLLRDALGEAQHLIADLLVDPGRSPDEGQRLRALVQHINEVIDRVDD